MIGHAIRFWALSLARSAALIVLISLLSGVAHGQEQDCEHWKRKDGLEYSGIKLGSSLSDIPSRYRLEKSRSEQRYLDGLAIDVYSAKGVAIDTIRCADSRQIVVGISSGDLILGKTTVDNFIARQKDDLERVSARDISQHVQGRKLSLWGIKGQFEQRNAFGVTDFRILRRVCITQTVPDNADTCGLSYWQVHLVRSKYGN